MAETLGGPVVPTVGLGMLIATLATYILRALVSDRGDYRDRITAEQGNAARERDRADLAQLQVDEEMRSRRDAERRAAVAEAELAGQGAVLAWHAAELERLRAEVERLRGTGDR